MSDNRICFNKKLVFRHFFRFLSDLKPFITSHHPDCQYFRDHYIVVRGTKICIGCLFTFSTVFVVLLIHSVFGLWNFIPKDLTTYIMIGALFMGLYATGIFGKNKKLKILSKIIFGFIFTVIILIVYDLPYSSGVMRIAVTLLTIMIITYVVGGIRAYGIVKVCNRCPEKDSFPFCSGFREIMNRLLRDNFIRIC